MKSDVESPAGILPIVVRRAVREDVPGIVAVYASDPLTGKRDQPVEHVPVQYIDEIRFHSRVARCRFIVRRTNRNGMKEHHARAITKATERLRAENPDIVAILLGGSIAKGIERDNSDVDLIVVIPDTAYQARLTENRVGFLWKDACDYEGGYVEGRFVSRSYILEAAQRASEPTRHSFTGSYAIYCTDPAVEGALHEIPVYPEQEQHTRINSFLAQMQLNRWFFWGEGKRRGDRYLQTRAATEIVLFGCRLILAYNKQLFACQKRLVEQTLNAPQKPDRFGEKIDRFLSEMSDEAKEDFCKAIDEFADWGKSDVLSRFLQDVEMSWFTRTHAISEW